MWSLGMANRQVFAEDPVLTLESIEQAGDLDSSGVADKVLDASTRVCQGPRPIVFRCSQRT